jgi:hypothetical protein
MPRQPPFDRTRLAETVAVSRSISEVLRRLEMRPAGGNHSTVKKYVTLWGISTDHFDPSWARRQSNARRAIPLAEVLVEASTYDRGQLKQRLYDAGLKERRCELCGQGEEWKGRRMSLILDHINGRGDDHRLENLRIVCPNCAATLDTHCGRNPPRQDRECIYCGETFSPKAAAQRYCSRVCASRHGRRLRRLGVPHPNRRKVERPPYEVLLHEIREMGYRAVGRKYGVSDNAVRKWVRWYENERAATVGGAAPAAGTQADLLDRRAA